MLQNTGVTDNGHFEVEGINKGKEMVSYDKTNLQ